MPDFKWPWEEEAEKPSRRADYSTEKLSGSALRERIKLLPRGRKIWDMVLGDRRVGRAHFGREGISGMMIQPEFRGMGLGKKFYGELMRRQPDVSLASDDNVSVAARRVWEGMKDRPGYSLETNPSAILEEGRSAVTLGGQPVYEGSLPLEARVRPENATEEWDTFAALADKMRVMNKESSARKEKDLELWRKWKQTKSPYDLQNLMRQMDPVIQSEVNKWSGAIARPVLEAHAKKLALEAFETYDPNKGAALNTHLTNRLKKLSRKVYTHQDAVRVPEYKKLKINAFMKGQDELMSQHGREPTSQELSDHLGWSPKMVSDIQSAISPELIESEDVGAGLFENQSVWGSNDDAMVDMVYYDLSPTDKIIFEHSTGYGGKRILSNSEIMKKTGLTQGQLSYRKRKIVDRLQDVLD